MRTALAIPLFGLILVAACAEGSRVDAPGTNEVADSDAAQGGAAGDGTPPVLIPAETGPVDDGGGGPLTATEQPPPPTAMPAGGDVLAPGFSDTDRSKLNATPAAAAAPKVAYPPAHALFAANMAPIEIHLTKGVSTQALARVTFHVDGGFDLSLYDRCTPAELDPKGCILRIPAEVVKKLGDANYFGALTVTVRLSDPYGADVGEVALDNVSFTYSVLTGGLYYWTTMNTMSPTAIKRYDFSRATEKPEVYWQQVPDSPKLQGKLYSADDHACMGCHAISRDGTKIALSFGGSLPAAFELADVATKAPIAQKLDGDTGYASMTAFSPDGARIINSYHGKLLLRSADAALSDFGALFEQDTAEPKSHAFWSPRGDLVAFVSFLFSPTADVPDPTGDTVQNGQIWTAPSDGHAVTGAAKLLVPRDSAKASYYPAVSDDGKFVVYNQSSCDGPTSDGWGTSPCDGYNDVSARIMVVPSAGGTPVDLSRANADADSSNSWPRFSPDHGSFGGKSVYWVAFSSRRPYGLRIQGAKDASTKPQLWFAAVQLTAGQAIDQDPSFAAVWLPGQNDDMTMPSGNHSPQWVLRSVPIVIR